jgi:hypothetical protein
MGRAKYVSIRSDAGVDRRGFLKIVGAASVALSGRAVLGRPADEPETGLTKSPGEVETNIEDFMKVPRGPHAIPGPFPGRIARVCDPSCMRGGRVDPRAVARMVERGIATLTGRTPRESFKLFFTKDDVVGIKVNPVGAPLIHVRPEVVEALVAWLVKGGLPRKNIVIWDRFDDMLKEAGYTPERFPGVRIAALQTMTEEGKPWRNANGEHVSAANFDKEAFYYAKGVVGRSVPGYETDDSYQNQHVFAGEYSYFGKLLTKEVTKIINVASFKNTGNGISMASKNLGYGAICNTGRLHQPLFFRVCTEVVAAPWIRDKLVLNVTDGIRAQYDGGPMGNAAFVYPHRTLYFATDPFALDAVCHDLMVAKRKAMKVKVNEHPKFTDYLRYAERLGLGVVDPARTKILEA